MEVKELLRELVTDEMIERAVIERVSERFSGSIDDIVDKKVRELAEDKADELLRERLDEIMSNGVAINDGWGRKETYVSFEDFVRQEIKKGLNDNWSLETRVRKAVESKLETYAKQFAKNDIEERTDGVLTKIAEDYAKSDL